MMTSPYHMERKKTVSTYLLLLAIIFNFFVGCSNSLNCNNEIEYTIGASRQEPQRNVLSKIVNYFSQPSCNSVRNLTIVGNGQIAKPTLFPNIQNLVVSSAISAEVLSSFVDSNLKFTLTLTDFCEFSQELVEIVNRLDKNSKIVLLSIGKICEFELLDSINRNDNVDFTALKFSSSITQFQSEKFSKITENIEKFSIYYEDMQNSDFYFERLPNLKHLQVHSRDLISFQELISSLPVTNKISFTFYGPFNEIEDLGLIPEKSEFINNPYNDIPIIDFTNQSKETVDLLSPLFSQTDILDLTEVTFSLEAYHNIRPRKELRLPNLTLQFTSVDSSVKNEEIEVNIPRNLINMMKNQNIQLKVIGSTLSKKLLEVKHSTNVLLDLSEVDTKEITIRGPIKSLNTNNFPMDLKKFRVESKEPITHIEESFFYIEKLELPSHSYTRVLTLTQDYWHPSITKYSKLTQLSIENKEIDLTTIPWDKILHLEYLSISPNIHKFDSSRLGSLFQSNLHNLTIIGNSIDSLCECLNVEDLFNLQHLDLSHNLLNDFVSINCLIPKRTKHFSLVLHNNRFTSINTTDWVDNNLYYVTSLDMRDNLNLTIVEFPTTAITLTAWNFFGCKSLTEPKNMQYHIMQMQSCIFEKSDLLPDDYNYDGNICESIMKDLKIRKDFARIKMKVINVVGTPYAGKTTLSEAIASDSSCDFNSRERTKLLNICLTLLRLPGEDEIDVPSLPGNYTYFAAIKDWAGQNMYESLQELGVSHWSLILLVVNGKTLLQQGAIRTFLESEAILSRIYERLKRESIYDAPLYVVINNFGLDISKSLSGEYTHHLKEFLDGKELRKYFRLERVTCLDAKNKVTVSKDLTMLIASSMDLNPPEHEGIIDLLHEGFRIASNYTITTEGNLKRNFSASDIFIHQSKESNSTIDDFSSAIFNKMHNLGLIRKVTTDDGKEIIITNANWVSKIYHQLVLSNYHSNQYNPWKPIDENILKNTPDKRAIFFKLIEIDGLAFNYIDKSKYSYYITPIIFPHFPPLSLFDHLFSLKKHLLKITIDLPYLQTQDWNKLLVNICLASTDFEDFDIDNSLIHVWKFGFYYPNPKYCLLIQRNYNNVITLHVTTSEEFLSYINNDILIFLNVIDQSFRDRDISYTIIQSKINFKHTYTSLFEFSPKIGKSNLYWSPYDGKMEDLITYNSDFDNIYSHESSSLVLASVSTHKPDLILVLFNGIEENYLNVWNDTNNFNWISDKLTPHLQELGITTMVYYTNHLDKSNSISDVSQILATEFLHLPNAPIIFIGKQEGTLLMKKTILEIYHRSINFVPSTDQKIYQRLIKNQISSVISFDPPLYTNIDRVNIFSNIVYNYRSIMNYLIPSYLLPFWMAFDIRIYMGLIIAGFGVASKYIPVFIWFLSAVETFLLIAIAMDSMNGTLLFLSSIYSLFVAVTLYFFFIEKVEKKQKIWAYGEDQFLIELIVDYHNQKNEANKLNISDANQISKIEVESNHWKTIAEHFNLADAAACRIRWDQIKYPNRLLRLYYTFDLPQYSHVITPLLFLLVMLTLCSYWPHNPKLDEISNPEEIKLLQTQFDALRIWEMIISDVSLSKFDNITQQYKQIYFEQNLAYKKGNLPPHEIASPYAHVSKFIHTILHQYLYK